MSVRAMIWAWETSITNQTELLVLLALADHADNDGVCWPGERHIGRKARVSERTVRDALKRLKRGGFIEVEQRRGKSNIYHLNLDNKVQPATVEAADTPAAVVAGVASAGTLEDVAGVLPDTPADRLPGTPAAAVAGEPLRTINNLHVPAHEAGAAPDGAPASVPGEGKDTPGHQLAAAIARFKDALPAFREAVGETIFGVLAPTLIVVSDDGRHLTLGQPSVFLRDYTIRYVDALREANDRESVEIVVKQKTRVGAARALGRTATTRASMENSEMSC